MRGVLHRGTKQEQPYSKTLYIVAFIFCAFTILFALGAAKVAADADHQSDLLSRELDGERDRRAAYLTCALCCVAAGAPESCGAVSVQMA